MAQSTAAPVPQMRPTATELDMLFENNCPTRTMKKYQCLEGLYTQHISTELLPACGCPTENLIERRD
jgi:hypothetical protein